MHRWITTRSMGLALIALAFVVALLFLAKIPQSVADSDAPHPEAQMMGSTETKGSEAKEMEGAESEEMQGSMHKEEDEDEEHHAEEEPGSLEDVMEGLLETNQAMLEALTDEGDAGEVAELAGELVELGEWAAAMGEDKDAPESYMLYVDTLMRQARNLREAAKDEDLEASALFLGQIQLTCVQCHSQVRR